MFSRMQRLFGLASKLNQAPNDQLKGPLHPLPSSSSICLGALMTIHAILPIRIFGRVIRELFSLRSGLRNATDCHSSTLFIRDSAGNMIIMQNSYQTASGGLGDIYRCIRKWDSGSDEVAVKSPRFTNLSESETARVNKSINREVKIWGGLKHQYVLPFLGTVEGFGRFPAFLFPWMPNGNLNCYLIRTDVSLTAMGKLILLRQITNGLKYLHDNGVIHGDLTSNNILIAADGSPGLADFGTSNIIRQSDNTFSYHPGAVRWVAPECMVVQEEEAIQFGTKSADIYALGCIILEVLYGKVPYWWIKHAMHVTTAKFKGVKPINSSIDIESIHLDFMQQCWSDESETRPSVDDALCYLGGYSFIQAEVGVSIPVIEKKTPSGSRPILKPKDDLTIAHCNDAKLVINIHPTEELGPAIDGSVEVLDPLLKCIEGDNFDLWAISEFLFPDSAEWQNGNFTTCGSIILDPATKLVLESRDAQSKKFRGVVAAISNDIISHKPFVQAAAIELLEVVAQSEDILTEFAIAISRISSAIASMSTATQIIALKILEIAADSNIHELVQAVAHTFHYVIQPIFSSETGIQIAALRVLKAGVGTKDSNLARIVKSISLVVKKLQVSGGGDNQGTKSQLPEVGICNDLELVGQCGMIVNFII